MAPPAKITFANHEQDEIRALEEEREPDVLPADFGEWDSGSPPTTLPDNFEDFDTVPRAPAPGAEPVMPEPPAVRGQASAYADFGEPSEPAQSKREKAAAEAKRRAEAEAEVKAQAEARRQAEADAKAEAKAEAEARRQAEADAKAEAKAQAEARRQAEAEARAEAKAEAEARKQAEAEARRRARTQARAEEEEEEEEERKGKSKMWVIAAIVAVLLGAFGVYYTLYLRKPVPKPAVAELTTAQPAESTSAAQTAKPKPGPATPAATTTATPTTDADTAQTAEQPTAASAGSDAMQKQIEAQSVLKGNLKPQADTSAPPPTSGIDMGTGNAGAAPNVFGSKPALNVAPAAPKTISVAASIMAGRAISKPQPVYPSFAKTARVEGTVVLHATISKTGTIQNVSVVSGPQMLRQAALDAVKTWRYKPYLLDNEPVEVETNVDVIFVLSR
jgi:TonB family protein